MSALHILRRLSSGRLIFAGQLAVLAAVPAFAPRPDGRFATTPSAIVRAPLGEDASCNSPYAAPFGVGERLEYSVKFGMFRAGTGYVEVLGRDKVSFGTLTMALTSVRPSVEQVIAKAN